MKSLGRLALALAAALATAAAAQIPIGPGGAAPSEPPVSVKPAPARRTPNVRIATPAARKSSVIISTPKAERPPITIQGGSAASAELPKPALAAPKPLATFSSSLPSTSPLRIPLPASLDTNRNKAAAPVRNANTVRIPPRKKAPSASAATDGGATKPGRQVIMQATPRSRSAAQQALLQIAPEKMIVARVGTEQLTKQEVQKQLQLFTRDFNRDFAGSKSDKERLLRGYERRIIGDWIETKLLAIEAKRRGIKAPQDEIDRHIQGTAHDSGILVSIQERLKMLGLTEKEFAEAITDAVLGDKLVRRSIRDKLPDAELQKHYKEQPAMFMIWPSRQARQICALFPPQATAKDKAALEDEIKKIRRRLTWLNAKFEDYANMDPSTGIYYRDIGWLTVGEPTEPERQFLYTTLFKSNPAKPGEQAEYSLKKGEISELVKSDYGYHVLQVIDERPARWRTIEEARLKVENDYYEPYRLALLEELRTKYEYEHSLEGLLPDDEPNEKTQRTAAAAKSVTEDRQPEAPAQAAETTAPHENQATAETVTVEPAMDVKKASPVVPDQQPIHRLREAAPAVNK